MSTDEEALVIGPMNGKNLFGLQQSSGRKDRPHFGTRFQIYRTSLARDKHSLTSTRMCLVIT